MSGSEEKRLMKGNEAIAEAAIRAGCMAYYGYPITPQNELIAWMAREMLARGRVFIQAESEIGAISMVYGSSAAGVRAMTSSSSPGVSLKQEGISYGAGADVPMVIVNVARAGPGLGAISPAQGDYFQSTRGGGHGDYHTPVLAPWSVQECADLTYRAFDLADTWRMPVVLLADGVIGQMLEGVVLPPERDPASLPKRDWSVGDRREGGSLPQARPIRHVTSLDLEANSLEAKINARFERYKKIQETEVRWEEIGCDDADLILVAYGTSARVCLGVHNEAAARGLKIGLLRPITLWPFPTAPIAALAAKGKHFLCVEMSMGQMVEDVRLVVNGAAPVAHFGRVGGNIPTEEEVLTEALRVMGRKE